MQLKCPSPRDLALMAGLVGCAAVAPAGAQAAVRTSTYKYDVQVKTGALASGTVVKASATVRNADPSAKDRWSFSTVRTVVRKGVNNGFQQPYSSEGYRCTPTVKAQTTSFDCKLQGADVPTTIDLRYSVRYRAR